MKTGENQQNQVKTQLTFAFLNSPIFLHDVFCCNSSFVMVKKEDETRLTRVNCLTKGNTNNSPQLLTSVTSVGHNPKPKP